MIVSYQIPIQITTRYDSNVGCQSNNIVVLAVAGTNQGTGVPVVEAQQVVCELGGAVQSLADGCNFLV
jgi:hypothetical protein